MDLDRISRITLVIFINLSIVLSNSTVPSNDIIKCFQCNSVEHIECADLTLNDTSSPFYRECDSVPKNGTNKPFCRKVKDTIKSGKDTQETTIVRSCGWIWDTDKAKNDSCKKGDTDFILRTSCVCFSDACNSGYKISSNLALVLVPIVVVKWLKFYLS